MADEALSSGFNPADRLGGSQGFWKGHLQGTGRLVTAFWVIGVLIPLAAQVVLSLGIGLFAFLVVSLGASAEHLGVQLLGWGSTALALAFFAYIIYSLVAIWRCAFNTSWNGWGYLARAYVIVVPVLSVLSVMVDV